MSTNDPIEIIDVIHHYDAYSTIDKPQILMVISRNPQFVYTQTGNRLMAHDGGFYDFMYIEPPSAGFKAFAGREFDIQLADGSTLHCKGQVWAGGGSDVEPMIHVGCATLEELEKCYVFCGGVVSKAKYDAWMAVNAPSLNYEKYDPRSQLSWLEKLYRDNPDFDSAVSPKRARKLRQRGVTLRRHPVTGARGWSPNFERRKAEIIAKNAPGYKGKFHPDNRPSR